MSIRLVSWLILIWLSMVWGSSFVLMKFAQFDDAGNKLLSANELGAMRMFLAGLSIAPLLFRVKKVTIRKHSLPILVVALFGNGIPAFLFAEATNKLDSGYVGMLNSTVPVFTVIISVFVYGTRLKWVNASGVFLALFGTLGLLYIQNPEMQTGDLGSSMLVIAATLCYAISINVTRQYLRQVDPLEIATLAFSFLMIPTGIWLFFFTDFSIAQTTEHSEYGAAVFYVAILAIIGTSYAVAFFNRLIAVSSAIFASTVTYMIPVVAIFWGIYFGETINWKHILFMLIILIGVFLVNRPVKRT